MTKEQKLEIFEKTFFSGTAGIYRKCNCGREFYSSYSGDRNFFDEGEYEALLENKNATGLDYSVGTLYDGSCIDCNCWHEGAIRTMNFLNSNIQCIKKYYKELSGFHKQLSEKFSQAEESIHEN